MKFDLIESEREGTIYTDFTCSLCGESPKAMRGWFGQYMDRVYYTLMRWHITRCTKFHKMSAADQDKAVEGLNITIPRPKELAKSFIAECPCGFTAIQKTEYWANRKLTEHYTDESPECRTKFLFDMKVKRAA